MNARSTALRTLERKELALVGGGFSVDEFWASAGAGAAVGASIGTMVTGPVYFGYGAALGAFVGSVYGGAYYAAGELIDYCF